MVPRAHPALVPPARPAFVPPARPTLVSWVSFVFGVICVIGFIGLIGFICVIGFFGFMGCFVMHLTQTDVLPYIARIQVHLKRMKLFIKQAR